MKKTWKRLGALLLAVVMTLSLLPTAAFAEDGDAAEKPTVIKYIQQTGAIEPGEYLIYSPNGSRNLHEGDSATNQCDNPTPAGDELGVGDGKHQWSIAGDATNGYTIQGVSSQKYLTANASGSQLALGDSSAAVKLTFTPDGNGGYQVTNKADSQYFRFNSNHWEFSATEGTVQLFKATEVEIMPTRSAIDAGWYDVGANPTKGEDGTWSPNYSSDGLTAEAGTQCTTSDGNDGPASYALDENTGHWWHNNWHDKTECSKPENLWISIKFSAATEIAGFRYLARSGETNCNGFVMDYEIQVQKSEGGAWEKVAEGNWGSQRTTSDLANGQWRLATFEPVSAVAVRLVGKTTSNADTSGTFMHAVAIRAVKADAVLPVTGKITTDGTNGLDGATVTLVQNNAQRSLVPNIQATTDGDGNYSLNLNTLSAGTYRIRASKPGYDAVIGETVITLTADRITGDTNNNATLTEIASNAKYAWNFNEGDGGTKPADGALTAGSGASTSYENNALKLSWSDSVRANNLVQINKTNAKNCVVEFDATRLSGSNRFGLGVRIHGEEKYWVYVGQFNNASQWGAEIYKNTQSGGWSANVNSLSFDAGETRHFKVTLNNEYLTLAVDGVVIINNQRIKTFCGTTDANSATVPEENILAAGDVGFLYGNTSGAGACDVLIDNLYVFRNDPANQVSWEDSAADGTISAKYTENEVDTNIVNGNTQDGISAGNTITITGAPASGKVLDSITVKKITAPEGGGDPTESTLTEAELAALGIARAEENKFTFTMPAYSVKVTGNFLPTVTGVTIKAGDGTSDPVLKVGKTLKAVVEPEAAAEGVTYQWYHLNNEGESGEAWVACTGGNEATKTISSEDQGKKIKVVVTGDGTAYASTVSVNAETADQVAAADIPVTAVGFTRNSLTMWSNLDNDPDTLDNSVMGNTATLTANVTPNNADPAPTYVWSVVKENGDAWTDQDIITLATDATETNTKQITANKAGKVWVKVTVTGGENEDGSISTVSATIPVEVKTGITSITLKQGSTELDSNSVLTIYANDGDSAQSVTVNAEVNDGADAAALVWSCDHEGDHIFHLGPLTSDAGSAAGGSVAITAYNNHTLVGEETVTVSAPTATGNTAQSVSFKVRVVHKINTTEHSVSISGTPKIDAELGVNLANLPMSDMDKGELTYQWKRNGEDISGATGSTYTPKMTSETDTDVGATISVVVKATPDSTKQFYYSGELTATTANTVEKKDAPATPALTPNKPTQEGESDGYITITNYDSESGYTYQIKGGTAYADWTDATVTNGKIEGLAAGTYSVKVKETGDRKESAAATTTIAEGDAVEYTITATQPTEGATISVNGTATKGEAVTISLTVTAGWKVDAVKVDGSADGVTAGDNNTWTFSMPEKNVTVTAEVSKIQVKITHNLGAAGLSCSLTTHDEQGNHVVNYGEVHEIELTAAAGYNLPSTIQVTYTDGGSEVPTERCEYDNSTGKITFPQGIQRNITITATATKKTYTASFNPSSGGNLTRAFTSATPVEHGTELTATLTPAEGYSVPETSVEVTMVGSDNPTFTYAEDATTHVVTITVSNVTGNVVIKANAVRITAPLTRVIITIQHTDSSTDEATIPHVGDTLLATAQAGDTAAPVTATATYQWFVVDNGTETSAGTGQSYTVKAADEGKTIKVVATGTEAFTDTANATTAQVKVKTVKTTGISIAAAAATVKFGTTLQLTATVEPDDASDKTVTWTSSDESIATVDSTGKVTPVKVSSTPVTITAKSSGGQEDTHSVTVTAAEIGVTLSSNSPRVGQELTATITPSDVSIRTITWSKVDAQGTVTHIDTDANATAYTPTAADVGYKIRVSVEVANANYANNDATTTNAVPDASLPSYAITVAAAENGTVSADPTEAAEGATVTLTVTPANGYTLGTLKVTKADNSEVTVTDNTFTMPAEDVTVTATFVATAPAPGTYTVAFNANGGTPTPDTQTVAENGTATVPTAPTKTGFTFGGWYANDDFSGSAWDFDTDIVTGNITLFAKWTEDTTSSGGDAPTVPEITTNPDGSSTTTTTNPDGSTTTTVTDAATGTVTETTEKPDGTVETKETLKDGTVTETTEKPDGTVETKETTPDGTVTETTEKPDGSSESVKTEPDGTVTETAIDAEGGKVEKVTTPEEDVTITVTGKDGEELAKVELPAEIPEPETRFVDVPVDHWADTAIHNMAALEVVNGVGGNRYDMDSSMTRGALATVLSRLSDGKKGLGSSFADVDADQWYADGIAWAAKTGVVTGYSATEFGPNDPITREQLAVMLCRYARLLGMDTAADAAALDGFTDGSSTDNWAVDSMAWCVDNGILKGMGDDTLAPTATATRAQVAVMLQRFIDLVK